jgi:hypothetical protein
MKPLPAPDVPGNTDAEQFDNAVRRVFSVSKGAYLKEEARLKRARDREAGEKAMNPGQGIRLAFTACLMGLLLLVSCGRPGNVSTASEEQPAANPVENPKQQPETPGFGPGRIDKTVATGRIKNTINIDTNGCRTLEGFEQDIITPGTVRGCINLDRGDKVIGPLEVQVVMVGNTDPKPSRYARIEMPGKGEVWTFYAHLTK